MRRRAGPPERRPIGALWATLAGVALGFGVAACAGKPARTGGSEARTPVSAGPALTRERAEVAGPYDMNKQEIAGLWMQIRDWRVEMGLRVEPDTTAIPAARRQPVQVLRVCPEHPNPETATCRDTCNIADAICDNAERICDIAEELEGDAWAAEKCESAKASCKEATERCCDCLAVEAP
jgi:hypothetical protein